MPSGFMRWATEPREQADHAIVRYSDAVGLLVCYRAGVEVLMSNPRITLDPAVMLGKPCIVGTRITVELILRKLANGRSFDEIIERYPHITADDIRAALDYAAVKMRLEYSGAAE
jgi:uncharacterized protein (DUF433 family)